MKKVGDHRIPSIFSLINDKIRLPAPDSIVNSKLYIYHGGKTNLLGVINSPGFTNNRNTNLTRVGKLLLYLLDDLFTKHH